MLFLILSVFLPKNGKTMLSPFLEKNNGYIFSPIVRGGGRGRDLLNL